MVATKDFLTSKVGCIIRAILYVALTYIAPIIFISVKFKLFENTEGGLKFTGWGIVAVLILALGVFKLLKYICDNFAYSYLIGVLRSFISSVWWLLMAMLMCVLVVKHLDQCMFVLKWSCLTCFIGMWVNPFPLMAHKSKVKVVKEAVNGK
jgi:hypothetical protein